VCQVYYCHFFFFHFSDLAVPAALAALALGLAFAPGDARWTKFAAVYSALAVCGIGTQVIHRQGVAPKLDIADGDVALLDGCVINPPSSLLSGSSSRSS